MTVDIIIPCYYQSDVIRPGLEKIAQQTVLNDITVIMINDCSPNTENEYLDLREEFSSKFKLKYTKTQVNSGPGVARQIGINMAQSDWIMFMDNMKFIIYIINITFLIIFTKTIYIFIFIIFINIIFLFFF